MPARPTSRLVAGGNTDTCFQGGGDENLEQRWRRSLSFCAHRRHAMQRPFSTSGMLREAPTSSLTGTLSVKVLANCPRPPRNLRGKQAEGALRRLGGENVPR